VGGWRGGDIPLGGKNTTQVVADEISSYYQAACQNGCEQDEGLLGQKTSQLGS